MALEEMLAGAAGPPEAPAEAMPEAMPGEAPSAMTAPAVEEMVRTMSFDQLPPEVQSVITEAIQMAFPTPDAEPMDAPPAEMPMDPGPNAQSIDNPYGA